MPPNQKQGAFAQKVEQSLGIINGTKLWSPFPFAGLNLQDTPPAIDDKEFSYLENYFRLGNGYLRTAWDVGLPIFTTGGPDILPYFFWYNIGEIDYLIVFFSDGTATQIEQASGATTRVSNVPNTFYHSGGGFPICSQSGTQYLIIANNNTTDDYWLWDGVLLYSAGSVSPFIELTSGGANYNTPPTITPFGGTGSGASFTPTVQGGAVTGVQVTNPGSGYSVGDIVQLLFSNGGSDTSAQLQAVLSDGGVAAISISSGGSGYTGAPTIGFTGGGGGSGAAATAMVSGGAITSIVVTNPGSGYTEAPGITFTGGSGVGASAAALLTSNSVASVNVLSGGSGFTSAPLLEFIGGGGAGATGVAVLTGTAVASINITAGGSGYFNEPTLTISAPISGVTATATATVANGSVVAITITNAGSGYTGVPEIVITPNVSDTLAAGAGLQAVLVATSIASVTVTSVGSGYTSAPAVIVEAGANNSAYATVDMMPFGVSGSALETFNSRVWLANPFQSTSIPVGGDFQVSAAGSLTDFATSDGGVLFTNSDRFLRKQYVGIRQSNGYLYFFGDSSISVVSNIQTTGDPATTTFTYQNVDAQVGMAWRDSIQDYGRTIVFANEMGVYGLYGGAATKVSEKLDRLFANAIYPPDTRAIVPTSAVATIFSVKYYFLSFTVQDPETFEIRNVLIGWDQKTWSVFSQSVDFSSIATQEVSSLLTAWGTDGTSIYPLFSKASSVLKKRLTTKYYGNDQLLFLRDFLNLYIQAQDLSSGSGIDISVNMIASGIAVQPPDNGHIDQESVASTTFTSASYPAMLFQQPDFNAPPPYFPVYGTGTGGFSFSTLAAQFSTTSPDFALSDIVLAYQDNTAYQ